MNYAKLLNGRLVSKLPLIGKTLPITLYVWSVDMKREYSDAAQPIRKSDESTGSTAVLQQARIYAMTRLVFRSCGHENPGRKFVVNSIVKQNVFRNA
eukprot:scaffold1391_cov123-Cylindrotheca_fusiformis.AAC.1